MCSTTIHVLQVELQKRKYYEGAIDGVYGVLTAQAVYRAKYWLGYLKPDHVAGDLLFSYLEGKRKPNLAMRLLTQKRIQAQKKTKPMRIKALTNAVACLGQKERPANSNKVPWASEWYGVIGPWCAMAVSRWYVDAGSKVFKRGKYYSYVPSIVADAHAGRNSLAVTLNPEPGDLVCYDWNKDKVADHIGLFESWDTKPNFTAIEGNTALGNDSNGGEVMRRARNTSDVLTFVHVGK